MLTEKIRQIHARSRGTYGSPRIHAELQARGYAAGENRVARLMKASGLKGVSRRNRPSTTVRGVDPRPAPDLVDRNFTASRPDELWVADITYVPTDGGYLYLSVVIDAFSGRVVGWAMASHYAPNSCLRPWTWLPSSAVWRRRSTTPIRDVSTRQSPSGSGGRTKASVDGVSRRLL